MRLRFTMSVGREERAAAARAACEDPNSGLALSLVEMNGEGGMVHMRERVVDRETRKPVRGEKLEERLAPYLAPAESYVELPLLKPVIPPKPKPRPVILDGLGMPVL